MSEKRRDTPRYKLNFVDKALAVVLTVFLIHNLAMRFWRGHTSSLHCFFVSYSICRRPALEFTALSHSYFVTDHHYRPSIEQRSALFNLFLRSLDAVRLHFSLISSCFSMSSYFFSIFLIIFLGGSVYSSVKMTGTCFHTRAPHSSCNTSLW